MAPMAQGGSGSATTDTIRTLHSRADTNSPSCPSVTSSSVRAIGQSWTCMEKLFTFEQFRFQIGYMAY